jgi:hypothetical protein
MVKESPRLHVLTCLTTGSANGFSKCDRLSDKHSLTECSANQLAVEFIVRCMFIARIWRRKRTLAYERSSSHDSSESATRHTHWNIGGSLACRVLVVNELRSCR